MALSILYWAKYVEGHTKLTRKSEASVESGRVLKFIFDDLRVISASVQASMRDTSYKVQIILEQEDSGVVDSSSCQCPMGQYKCHHVAAVLLFGYKRASKTDVKCSWLKHPKSAPPKQTVTMDDLYPKRHLEYRALKRSVTDEDRSFLHGQLGRLGRFTALHWILSKEPLSYEEPVPLVEDLLMSEDYLSSTEPHLWLLGKLIVSKEKVVETAFITSGQRENAMWAAIRKLRFTASNFGQIISAANRKRLTNSLQKRLLSSYNLEKRAPIQWGITHESTAIEEYCKAGGVTVLPTGIWLHHSGILGASPDGFVQGDFSGNVQVHLQNKGQPLYSPDIIEVKCPFTAKDMTVKEAYNSIKNFYLDLSPDGEFTLKTTHDYWHQAQGQLHITGTRCCDFVVWTQKDVQIIRIVKDDTWLSNITVMIDFYLKIFLPALK